MTAYIQDPVNRPPAYVFSNVIKQTLPEGHICLFQRKIVFRQRQQGHLGLTPVSRTTLRRAATCLGFASTRIYAEMACKERPAFLEGFFQVSAVIRTPHAEIGEMVQVLPEEVTTITLVCLSIQNVSVPEFVDGACWANLTIPIHHIQSEKAAIEILHLILVLGRPSLFVTELPLKHAEIKLCHAFKRGRNLCVVLQKVLAFVPIQRTGGTGLTHGLIILPRLSLVNHFDTLASESLTVNHSSSAGDRIVVLDNGKIVETGSHASLLAKGGLYAGFWRRRSGGFITTDLEATE